MKLSDYVAAFLVERGVKHAFVLSGGASLHLIHSIGDTDGIDFICPQHEQAAAMAADAYSRITGKIGVAVATSGPGATNLITGVCCSYFDSVPILLLTGQVSTFRQRGDTGVRQIGFQETETVAMFRPVTKYAVMVTDPLRIRYELEKAIFVATSGRPGPVVVDIPDDIQRKDIDPDGLEGYVAPPNHPVTPKSSIEKCISAIRDSQRPVLVMGAGVQLSGATESILKLIETLKIPVVPTWAAVSVLPSDSPYCVGTFGTHGTRFSNFAVQNADLILSIGSRLDTKATGSPARTFARGAKKIVVDIDAAELNKFKLYDLEIDVPICSDAKEFVEQLLTEAQRTSIPSFEKWHQTISDWKMRYPVCLPQYREEKRINPYVFVDTLSAHCHANEIILIDTGCAIAWMMQGFKVKQGQRLIHDFNNTAMGYALPGAIGACFATDKRSRIICVSGDGSLLMNIQEMVTASRHQLPIKMFLLNNEGHSMIQQTQDQWLDSKYYASSVEGGLAFPDFTKVAKAFGWNTTHVYEPSLLDRAISETLEAEGPSFCNISLAASHRVIPQVRFGRALEDTEPLLDRREFLSHMIVPPDPSSLVDA